MKIRLVALMASALFPICSGAQTSFHIIRAFNLLQQPLGITEGSPGVFYFSAFDSANGDDQVLSIDTQGALTVVGSFPSSYNIQTPVISGPNGRFYSLVSQALHPTSLFSVTSVPGNKRVYAPLTLGFSPTQNLPTGELLGTAGTLSGPATWYLAKANLTGEAKTIYSFPSNETLPAFSALYGGDGNYYGVSTIPLDDSAYVYRVTPSGTLTKLWNFPAGSFSGAFNFEPLIQATDGNLYGVTPGASETGPGTIYKLTLTGQYTLLYTFPACPDCNPTTLIEASDGNLYGATDGNVFLGATGQLFRITTSGDFTLLAGNFDGMCHCQLVQGSDGVIYGTAQEGGPFGGGEIFALDLGLPKPAPRSQHFSPVSGSAGTQVLIWGYDLLSASVEFNGVPAAAVTGSGPNYVLATVPAGATTGPLTITTPNGSTTTQATFTVQ